MNFFKNAGLIGALSLCALFTSAARAESFEEVVKGRYVGKTDGGRACTLDLDKGRATLTAKTLLSTVKINVVVGKPEKDGNGNKVIRGSGLNNSAGDRIVGAPIFYLSVKEVKAVIVLDNVDQPESFTFKRKTLTVAGEVPWENSYNCKDLKKQNP